jgi:hypothetical protein
MESNTSNIKMKCCLCNKRTQRTIKLIRPSSFGGNFQIRCCEQCKPIIMNEYNRRYDKCSQILQREFEQWISSKKIETIANQRQTTIPGV